ncbi:hypothetical protein RRX38_04790 [Pseudomonas sp. DTU_2021_1001937_2_SI_NGA_ILE_001]|uniref:hypothetical protein n=1 Tax=Pseudomonas sp. DTU_2021_1001937_2_SI_NGA_ILE_001 TaxID=3077589 RepID=UPI0025CC0A1C|nr:hypothetical protein [Pseudomonas sp. DTU_2021_1001937_2_SI_NGA_ILE_001]WNW10495.1 hypothetical protein RRX38_04790 [Pseudomonas sp. DTU_2021_1001937_2_SI_NGA_ILE_001]
MPKGLVGKDYMLLVIAAIALTVLMLGAGFFIKPVDWAGWVQATGVVVALLMAVAVPAIQRAQQAREAQRQLREREIGYARRVQYLCAELTEMQGRINLNLMHLRASDRHHLKFMLQDYLHRLFESHKHDLNDDRIVVVHELRQVAGDLIDELESGRSDRTVYAAVERRLQKLAQRCQIIVVIAERL